MNIPTLTLRREIMELVTKFVLISQLSLFIYLLVIILVDGDFIDNDINGDKFIILTLISVKIE